MKKQWAVVAMAAMVGGAGLANANRYHRSTTATQEAEENAEHFEDWAKTKIKHLKDDIGRLDDRMKSRRTMDNQKDREKLSELDGRVDELEKRLKEPRAEATKDAAKDRKEIRERIEKLRKEFRDLEKNYRGSERR